MNATPRIIHAAVAGALPTHSPGAGPRRLRRHAAAAGAATEIRDRGSLNVVTYSRKVFLPLTKLCRDVCHYCTFSRQSPTVESAYLTLDQMLETARQGARLGCKEALFTLGEKPELRYEAAREALARLGFASTIDYLAHAAAAVFRETGLLPHINAGCLTDEELQKLRPVGAIDGPDAGVGLGAPVRARHAAPRQPGQAPGAAAGHAGGGRPPEGADDLGHPGGHRRDAARAHRSAAGAARHPLAPRQPAGSHRPELPRQARHGDGGPRRAVARRAVLDHRRGAHRARARHGHPGAAEPVAQRAAAPRGGRHQRLGRRVAADRRLRQSRGAVAAPRPARARDPRRRQAPAGAADDLSPLRP